MDQFETIRELISMLNLHTRGKKMRALEILEDYLFASALPSLSSKDLRLLLLGQDSIKGLIQSMGGENHIRKNLKNSSHYCLQLIVKILNIPKWKQDCQSILTSIDRLLIQQMKIDKHFKYSESSKSFAIYMLCLRISKAKPTLTPEILIQRKNFRDKFTSWASLQKPEDLVQESKEKPKTVQDILGLKPYLTLPANISALLIEQIDLKSPAFKANFYLARLHGSINPLDLPRGKENLRRLMNEKQNVMAKTISDNSIIFGETRGFFEEFKKNLNFQLNEGPGFMGKKFLEECESRENFSLAPLLKQRAEMERMKKLIQLTNKYSYLFKIPNTLQSHLSRADIDSVLDVYQKHVVIIKTYSHLPVFAKVMKNLESIMLSVKTFMLQQLRKNKKLNFETVYKTIQNLAIIEPKGEPIVDVAQVLYEIIDNYLENMWVRIDKQHELPWLIQEKSLSSDAKLKELAVEQFIIKILHQVYNYIEILSKLSSISTGKKIRRRLQKISKLLTEKLSMSLFQDDPDQPLRLVAIDEISLIVKNISKILQISNFESFCEEFTISFIKTKFHLMQIQISELWKDEIWSRDFENKYGTCIPRVFECLMIGLVNSLKTNLPTLHEKVVSYVGEGVNICCVSLFQAMKSALNNKQISKEFIGKGERTLLTLSNLDYLLKKVFPKLQESLNDLFNSVQELMTEPINQVNQFSSAVVNFFIERKSGKIFKVIEEGITFNEELIGLDANILYRHLISDGKELRELRAYVFIVVQKIAKIAFQLTRKAPHLKDEILDAVMDEVLTDIRKIIQKQHRSLETCDVVQIWAEVEFLARFLERKGDEVENSIHNLKKIWSKKKGLKKLALDSDVLNGDLMNVKENLINNELNKVKLIQSSLR